MVGWSASRSGAPGGSAAQRNQREEIARHMHEHRSNITPGNVVHTPFLLNDLSVSSWLAILNVINGSDKVRELQAYSHGS